LKKRNLPEGEGFHNACNTQIDLANAHKKKKALVRQYDSQQRDFRTKLVHEAIERTNYIYPIMKLQTYITNLAILFKMPAI